MQTDNFSMYMAEIRAVDLLTAEEEQELARAIEAGAFPPNPSTWKCSERWCEYWTVCRG